MAVMKIIISIYMQWRPKRLNKNVNEKTGTWVSGGAEGDAKSEGIFS